MSVWTEKDHATLCRMAKENCPASVIAVELGRTRNAIIGRAHRQGVQLNGQDYRGERAGSPVASTPRSAQPGIKAGATFRGERAPQPPPSNVIHIPVARLPLGSMRGVPSKAVKADAPAFRVITNTARSVEDWLKANGGPRRFERGFSTDYLPLKTFLEKRGVIFNLHRNNCLLSNGRGRPRKVSWDQVYRVADQFRIAEGLTPILPQRARA